MPKLSYAPTTPSDLKIAVIGLGYVGLPLAVEFGKQRSVVGFDINEDRVADLQRGFDVTAEVGDEAFGAAKYLRVTAEPMDLNACNCFIVTVPTPIDQENNPDLAPLTLATKFVGSILKMGDLVIYESTVYPGATEEYCVPLLEEVSGLKYNNQFFCGYSPERINPGDKEHRLKDIVKVTSGSTREIANLVDALYQEISAAGTHSAPSIRVAEAAKVIENVQRDLNIALVNELAIIFDRMGIDTGEVLEAAETKWNFIPFKPGLVGGHCIGVDPYYLTYKSQQLGYFPDVILAGRNLNDQMANYVANRVVSALESKKIEVSGARVLILGLTFKENCPDVRNTQVFNLTRSLVSNGCKVHIHDPWVIPSELSDEFREKLIDSPKSDFYDAIVLAVAHQEFCRMSIEAIQNFGKKTNVIFDLKQLLPKDKVDGRL